jgi:hypothetical protein
MEKFSQNNRKYRPIEYFYLPELIYDYFFNLACLPKQRVPKIFIPYAIARFANKLPPFVQQ